MVKTTCRWGRSSALGYARRYARGIEDDERSDRFVSMYVNH